MTKRRYSDAIYLLAFFAMLIAIGTSLLSLPLSWLGNGDDPSALPLVDALFISTSAVCVTGLSTVATADFSRFGQVVILLLIQVGGLGIISFTSLLLIIPGRRLPFRRLNTIRSFSVLGVEYDPIKIVRNIIFFTFSIEAIGAFALFWVFLRAGTENPLFSAVFHSVSAFCNAGFSLFPTSLEAFGRNPAALAIVSILIVTGGIGFIVLQDVERRIRGKRRCLSYHTKLVLLTTVFLICAGAAAFWFLEGDKSFKGMSAVDRAMNAIFQSITPRTAGFNAVPQDGLRQPSKFIAMILMFVGGAPGSIAGGIKVTTAFLVIAVMLRKPDEEGDITVFKRRISARVTGTAIVYFLKATALLVCAAGALSLTEGMSGTDFSDIVFETVSAFGTVGLSLGLTPYLSTLGKIVIIATMFAGRVGLIALAFPGPAKEGSRMVYPAADVILG